MQIHGYSKALECLDKVEAFEKISKPFKKKIHNKKHQLCTKIGYVQATENESFCYVLQTLDVPVNGSKNNEQNIYLGGAIHFWLSPQPLILLEHCASSRANSRPMKQKAKVQSILLYFSRHSYQDVRHFYCLIAQQGVFILVFAARCQITVSGLNSSFFNFHSSGSSTEVT